VSVRLNNQFFNCNKSIVETMMNNRNNKDKTLKKIQQNIDWTSFS
jgi:hypothetical protein